MTATPEAPAVTLRRAADKLRALATAGGITPGPWLSMDGGDRLIHDPGHDLDAPVYVVDEPMSNPANAAYIATMHPGVGQLLADLLDDAADGIEQDRRDYVETSSEEYAFKIAQQILGESP